MEADLRILSTLEKKLKYYLYKNEVSKIKNMFGFCGKIGSKNNCEL